MVDVCIRCEGRKWIWCPDEDGWAIPINCTVCKGSGEDQVDDEWARFGEAFRNAPGEERNDE